VVDQPSACDRQKSLKLSIAFYLLSALLATTPILAVSGGLFAQHAIALAVVIMLVGSAIGPQDEISAAALLLKRFSLAALFPVLWMTFQAIPLPNDSIVNPIWPTTRIALNRPSLPGHISLDPGATLRGLVSYLTFLALIVSTAVLTKSRHRAETTLLVLSTVTTLIAVEALLSQIAFFADLIPSAASAAASPLAAAAALGALTNGAVISMRVERHLTRSAVDDWPAGSLISGLVLNCAGIAVSLAAMKVLEQDRLFAATGAGFLVILFVAIVQHLDFRPRLSAILLAALIATAGVMSLLFFQPDASAGASAGLLAFITNSGQNYTSLALSQRALSDASWVGSGVGSFGLLSRAYQDFGVAPAPIPASTAISIAIEWGRPALVILLGFAAQFVLFALRGAVRRGRDSFFASGAAAGVLLVVCESFLDSSLLNSTVQIIVAVLVGLGLSQSAGRTSGL
jgi:hypothetical protein